VPKTGIISTQDLAGNAKDIHPTNKHDVGLRFARLALADTYRKEISEAHSPMIAGVRPDKKGRLRLEIKFSGKGLRTRDGLPPTQFKIAGDDRVFRPAHAELKADRVLVWSTEVPHPVAVRFCWGETAVSNVVNSSDLPLLPYRSDTWPVETIRP
jgi:sialate O-acetylesterase